MSDTEAGGNELRECVECGAKVDVTIHEGGSHRPIGPYPVRVCVVDGSANIHYLGSDTDQSGGSQ